MAVAPRAPVRLFNSLQYAGNGYPNADKWSMGSINSISSSYLQSILNTALPGPGSSSNPLNNVNASPGFPGDHSQLSPFARLMSELQQLQQTDPAKYKQVTQQIAANLQTAAQTAQSQGNATAANQLSQLSNDFTTASTTGQLPNIQDLAQATGATGAHVHHHHHHHSGGDSDSNSSSQSASSTDPLSQLLSAVQTNTNPNDALNPAQIILNTLSNAGITPAAG